MSTKMINEFCKLDRESEELVKIAFYRKYNPRKAQKNKGQGKSY